MNERAAEALVDAAMRGVRQIKLKLADSSGGRCAGGVIIEAITGAVPVLGVYDGAFLRHVAPLFNERDDCPHGCGWTARSDSSGRPKEWSVMVHMNNLHGDDFLTIARKLGPSGDAGA